MVHHSPVSPIYNKRGKLIGYKCDHCRVILTPGYQISRSEVWHARRGGGAPRVYDNKKHKERVAHARE